MKQTFAFLIQVIKKGEHSIYQKVKFDFPFDITNGTPWYSRFHKTLPKSGIKKHWILARFYDMGVRSTLVKRADNIGSRLLRWAGTKSQFPGYTRNVGGRRGQSYTAFLLYYDFCGMESMIPF